MRKRGKERIAGLFSSFPRFLIENFSMRKAAREEKNGRSVSLISSLPH
jgi:hypothetical protein